MWGETTSVTFGEKESFCRSQSSTTSNLSQNRPRSQNHNAALRPSCRSFSAPPAPPRLRAATPSFDRTQYTPLHDELRHHPTMNPPQRNNNHHHHHHLDSTSACSLNTQQQQQLLLSATSRPPITLPSIIVGSSDSRAIRRKQQQPQSEENRASCRGGPEGVAASSFGSSLLPPQMNPSIVTTTPLGDQQVLRPGDGEANVGGSESSFDTFARSGSSGVPEHWAPHLRHRSMASTTTMSHPSSPHATFHRHHHHVPALNAHQRVDTVEDEESPQNPARSGVDREGGSPSSSSQQHQHQQQQQQPSQLPRIDSTLLPPIQMNVRPYTPMYVSQNFRVQLSSAGIVAILPTWGANNNNSNPNNTNSGGGGGVDFLGGTANSGIMDNASFSLNTRTSIVEGGTTETGGSFGGMTFVADGPYTDDIRAVPMQSSMGSDFALGTPLVHHHQHHHRRRSFSAGDPVTCVSPFVSAGAAAAPPSSARHTGNNNTSNLSPYQLSLPTSSHRLLPPPPFQHKFPSFSNSNKNRERDTTPRTGEEEVSGEISMAAPFRFRTQQQHGGGIDTSMAATVAPQEVGLGSSRNGGMFSHGVGRGIDSLNTSGCHTLLNESPRVLGDGNDPVPAGGSNQHNGAPMTPSPRSTRDLHGGSHNNPHSPQQEQYIDLRMQLLRTFSGTVLRARSYQSNNNTTSRLQPAISSESIAAVSPTPSGHSNRAGIVGGGGARSGVSNKGGVTSSLHQQESSSTYMSSPSPTNVNLLPCAIPLPLLPQRHDLMMANSESEPIRLAANSGLAAANTPNVTRLLPPGLQRQISSPENAGLIMARQNTTNTSSSSKNTTPRHPTSGNGAKYAPHQRGGSLSSGGIGGIIPPPAFTLRETSYVSDCSSDSGFGDGNNPTDVTKDALKSALWGLAANNGATVMGGGTTRVAGQRRRSEGCTGIANNTNTTSYYHQQHNSSNNNSTTTITTSVVAVPPAVASMMWALTTGISSSSVGGGEVPASCSSRSSAGGGSRRGGLRYGNGGSSMNLRHNNNNSSPSWKGRNNSISVGGAASSELREEGGGTAASTTTPTSDTANILLAAGFAETSPLGLRPQQHPQNHRAAAAYSSSRFEANNSTPTSPTRYGVGGMAVQSMSTPGGSTAASPSQLNMTGGSSAPTYSLLAPESGSLNRQQLPTGLSGSSILAQQAPSRIHPATLSSTINLGAACSPPEQGSTHLPPQLTSASSLDLTVPPRGGEQQAFDSIHLPNTTTEHHQCQDGEEEAGDPSSPHVSITTTIRNDDCLEATPSSPLPSETSVPSPNSGLGSSPVQATLAQFQGQVSVQLSDQTTTTHGGNGSSIRGGTAAAGHILSNSSGTDTALRYLLSQTQLSPLTGNSSSDYNPVIWARTMSGLPVQVGDDDDNDDNSGKGAVEIVDDTASSHQHHEGETVIVKTEVPPPPPHASPSSRRMNRQKSCVSCGTNDEEERRKDSNEA